MFYSFLKFLSRVCTCPIAVFENSNEIKKLDEYPAQEFKI